MTEERKLKMSHYSAGIYPAHYRIRREVRFFYSRLLLLDFGEGMCNSSGRGGRRTSPKSKGASALPQGPKLEDTRPSSLTIENRLGARGVGFEANCEAKARKARSESEPYRRTAYGPPGSAWVRLGPDKFFSPLKKGAKNRSAGLWLQSTGTQAVGVGRFGTIGWMGVDNPEQKGRLPGSGGWLARLG
jgi:hypothetical protein